mmetsp:Transcript_9045/g.33349  ORF Transcript_9045/g.33349 Transcript_9045/m.33349 type:complete len:98 (+) Transcript_9045:156-449(+)
MRQQFLVSPISSFLGADDSLLMCLAFISGNLPSNASGGSIESYKYASVSSPKLLSILPSTKCCSSKRMERKTISISGTILRRQVSSDKSEIYCILRC